MDKLLKNQKLLSLFIFGGLLLIYLFWYYLIQYDLAKEHKRKTNAKAVFSTKVKKFSGMESQLISLQEEWEALNSEFINVIEKIPEKRLYDSVNDFLYTMIVNHGLKIQKFEPSRASVEKKTIIIPDSGNEITMEKIPIDINVSGSFINFGQLLESMATGPYRLTASSIEINTKTKTRDQIIKFICYAYFKSQINAPNRTVEKINSIRQPSKPSITDRSREQSQVKKEKAAVNKKLKSLPDSLEGVPEMWLEPATEPVEESVLVEAPIPNSKPKTEKKIIEKKEIKSIAEEKQIPLETNKLTDFYDNIEVINSLACKKVKNNQPLYPGKRFPTDIGKVYCHSLLNNNSGKQNDIYHIWYMNGNLKAKVRIRVRSGREIPAVSHREVANSDKGTWKIEITDSDKKILDTVIFEVV
tara:strand:+ start:4874 stop:6115 length:1242 start_codon:yes stop_codon:yes gene_type:complete